MVTGKKIQVGDLKSKHLLFCFLQPSLNPLTVVLQENLGMLDKLPFCKIIIDSLSIYFFYMKTFVQFWVNISKLAKNARQSHFFVQLAWPNNCLLDPVIGPCYLLFKEPTEMLGFIVYLLMDISPQAKDKRGFLLQYLLRYCYWGTLHTWYSCCIYNSLGDTFIWLFSSLRTDSSSQQ